MSRMSKKRREEIRDSYTVQAYVAELLADLDSADQEIAQLRSDLAEKEKQRAAAADWCQLRQAELDEYAKCREDLAACRAECERLKHQVSRYAGIINDRDVEDLSP